MRLGVPSGLVLLVASCVSQEVYQPITAPEVFSNASAHVSEAGIRAAISGSDLEVEVTVFRNQSPRLLGTLAVTAVDVGDPEEPVIGRGEVDFSQREERAAHTVVLAGAAAGLERPESATVVLRWSVDVPAGQLRGRRSLYAALGKIEIQLRGSTEVPVGGTVPFTVIARDPDTMQPLAGARVEATLSPEEAAVALFAGETDVRGELLVSYGLPPNVEGGQLRVEVTDGDSTVWATTRVRAVVDRKVYLSTDKTIYKPGQTILLRALGLEGTDRVALADFEAVFEARDGKGNKVFKRRVQTDEHGVASAELPTDTRVNEGIWQLSVTIAGATSSLRLPVERYNLPKMNVALSTLSRFVVPGDTLYARLDATYVFGEPVAGADVVVQITTSGGLFHATRDGVTLADGSFEFELPVPATLSGSAIDDGQESLILEALVIDTANQAETTTSALRLSSGPVVINAVPEAGGLLPGLDNVVYLTVSDPAGRPLVADLDVSGVATASLVTDASGVAELHFVPSDAVSADLHITATDGAERTHTRSFDLGGPSGDALVVRTDKAVYQAGEEVTLHVIAPPGVGRVYLDVFNGAQGVLSRSVPVNDGIAVTVFTVAESIKGMVVVDAFALAASAQVVRGSRRLLVDPRDRLSISIAANQGTYLPGEEAGVAINVRDEDGNPAVAAVGVGVVNEATFALGGEPANDIHTFFNLDARVLPADLRVLGRGAAELIGLQPGDERQRFAELLFAAARGIAGPGFEYNSIREELPAVKSALEVKVNRDAVRVLKSLAIPAQEGAITWQTAPKTIERAAARTVDPFGQRYRATVDSYQLQMTCAGPDETWETADDVSISTWYEWIFWADPNGIDDDGDWDNGGFFPGDMMDGAAGGAECGGGLCGAPEAREDDEAAAGAGGAGVRVRSDFRETVYANPLLITDAAGEARISFPLADSITTWRVTAEGSTADGKLGSARGAFVTFQDFFVDFDVPLVLTRGDVIELPAIVYNYLPEPQTVTVTLAPESWMTILSGGTQHVTLQPSEVRAVKFEIQVDEAGEHTLTLEGDAGGVSDALVRAARVMPDGQPDDQAISDKLNGTRSHTITVPTDAVADGTLVELTLTPGFASEVVQGTEGLMQEPNGCFEQTTSSAWPNTLVADYLEETGQMTDDMRDGIIGMVTRGYQRLLTFESPTGGYNWWGDSAPGNRILSAIMLWHLKDLESLIEIDTDVRDRTLAWLLEQQNADGSWEAGDALHAGNEVLGTDEVRTTAFIAWGLAHTGWADDAVASAAAWLRSNPPDAGDLYANALALNALAKVDPNGAATSMLLARLDDDKEVSEENRVLWPTGTPSWTGASGNVAALETTGLVAYGMMSAQAYPETTTAAMRFIVANKDRVGTWYNTQATMNALRALSAAASPQGSDAEGTLSVRVNGDLVTTQVITLEDGDVYRRIDLTDYVVPGDNTVELEMVGQGDLAYQLTRRSYRPVAVVPATGGLDLSVSYDTTNATVGVPVTATVVATNNDVGTRDQVLVRLGTAPGFVPRAEDLEALVAAGAAARYEVNATEVVFYLMGLAAGESRQLVLRLTPTLVAQASAPASSIYAYYEKTVRAEVEPELFVVTSP